MIGALYRGAVMHRRHRPVGHAFRYRVFAMVLDLDRIGDAVGGLRLLSWNRFNLFSFHDRDHGARDGSALRPWVEQRLREAGVDGGDGPIRLLCFPRLLGYVFNPLSVYFCHRADGSLAAAVYEVKNTFGEQHTYVLPATGEDACDKAFYVSPFIDMKARYRFRLHAPDDRVAVAIREGDSSGPLLDAAIAGRRAPLADRELAKCFVLYPLMTLKVIVAIHFEALRLWRKGIRLHPHSDATPPRELPADGDPVRS